MAKTDAATLVILTPGFPKNEQDTTCLPSQQLLVLALNRIFPNVKIIILSFQYPFQKGSYSWNGNTVFSYYGWHGSKWKKFRTYWSVWTKLRKLRRENNLVGLLSFWYTECALISNLFGRFHGLKHYAWILGQDAKKENKYPKLIKPRPEELIALSEFLAKEFEKNHGVKPGLIVPNAIDESLFPTDSTTRDIDLLGVGSLIPLKQYEIFLEVVKVLAEKFPGLKCLICGQGPSQEELQSLIFRLGIEDNVSLVGEIPHHEVLAIMQRSKILLHPSSYEGYSTVCLEALFAGAQVISFCNPKDSWIKHWHIASEFESMVQIAAEILSDEHTNHERVRVFSMNEQAQAIMRQFVHNETAIL